MPMVPLLRPGDVVQLRSPAEILGTLDEAGLLAGMPFMPEMLQYFGLQLTVAKRVEKICDTICPIGSRRMRDTVFLEDIRCDGSYHGGCEAECRLYWKSAWLVPLAADAAPQQPDPKELAALEAFLRARIYQPDGPDDGRERYRCQATEARKATEPLGTWEPGQYAREISSGNVTVGRFLRVAVQAGGAGVAAKLRRYVGRPLVPTGPKVRETATPLGLQPGEWVEVRPASEILATLDQRSSHRGLLFAPSEMLPACGKRFKVRRRIEKIVDEKTGRMLSMKHDCIVLDGFVCTGDRSHRRWFCAREIYPYWREAWLRRVN